ncbi:MAG TPA: transglycosylase family protein [Thermoleophilaceae bacterium]|nr:transglycosylase family protein [Thermoleophilaceae bacterium]
MGHPLLALALVAVALACSADIAAADRTGGASSASEVVVKRGDRGDAVRKVQEALGVGVDGVFGPVTERAVKRFQRRHGLLVDGIVGPQTRGALGLRAFSSRGVVRNPALPHVLRRIAECESGGDPTAVSRSGRYRGKYQFSMGTWREMGGEGDPAEASEWLQDRIALKLYRRAGTSPWPNCP